jgi:organic hydroperoxide reductase OsmC/OhrA
MGESLGRAGVSVEGGGAWLQDQSGVGHFLVADSRAAREALDKAGIAVIDEREVLVQRLNQDEAGQLGKLTRRMANAGVNIETLYSDHDHQLILVVDDAERGQQVSDAWEQERADKVASRKSHHYHLALEWIGADNRGTQSYRSYRRDFTITSAGKPAIAGSSDPAFRGDALRYNPEEFLVASLSSCHMLTYLHLCSVNSVVVVAYADNAFGVMRETAQGSGEFERVELRPSVTITEAHMAERARVLHEEAHSMCFIARSVNFRVEVVASILLKD